MFASLFDKADVDVRYQREFNITKSTCSKSETKNSQKSRRKKKNVASLLTINIYIFKLKENHTYLLGWDHSEDTEKEI